jgi:Uri superfamily endonuclease
MSKGTYLLRLQLLRPRRLRIGRLGSYHFAAGHYLYVGSALGPGGLAARLAYHQRREKARPHWHIDYLRPHTHLQEAWTITCARHLEEEWGSALLQLPGLQTPVPGFGSSDTKLPTHLFYISRQPSSQRISRVLLAASPLDDPAVPELAIEIHRFQDA